jgi:hypothetical protein
MPTRPTTISLGADAQRKLASELFNYVWTLLEKPDRTAHETELMVAAAYASRFFWELPGGPVQHVRSQWQVSRVCATAGISEEALAHARRCLALCVQHGVEDFDLAYAYEALARAHHVAGDDDTAREYAAQARARAALVTDQNDRDLVEGDLATLPS